MRDIMGMMGKVKEMQERMQAMQEELAAAEIEGAAGGGMVSVTTTGKGDLKSVRIDPSLLKPDEAEIVEDLVVAAVNDAKSKAEAQMQERMAEITGGLPLPPGMKLF
ncbi:MAG: YbaB/EbfC family nucleoid-associated protein [Pseudomonadota bacterium]